VTLQILKYIIFEDSKSIFSKRSFKLIMGRGGEGGGGREEEGRMRGGGEEEERRRRGGGEEEGGGGGEFLSTQRFVLFHLKITYSS
jgi:hypothetical protein